MVGPKAAKTAIIATRMSEITAPLLAKKRALTSAQKFWLAKFVSMRVFALSPRREKSLSLKSMAAPEAETIAREEALKQTAAVT